MIKIKRVRTHAQLPGARVRVCRPACMRMRKRHSTVRARVRVNEFAIEFEENLRIRWQLQKNNRAPLFAKYVYEQPQPRGKRDLRSEIWEKNYYFSFFFEIFLICEFVWLRRVQKHINCQGDQVCGCWNLKKHTKTLGNPGRILPKHACQDFRILRAHFWYSCQDPARMQVSWQDPARIARILAGSWQSWRTHATSCGTRPAPPQKCMYLGQIKSENFQFCFFCLVRSVRFLSSDKHAGMVRC